MGMFRNRLQQFFYGRNGPDTISTVLTWVALPFALAGVFAGGVAGIILFGVYALMIGYALFRMFSRNVYARQRENQAFLAFFRKIRSFFKLQKQKWTDRDHAYRKCPSCKSQLRLPKKKGKHTVRCPKCRTEFDVRI